MGNPSIWLSIIIPVYKTEEYLSDCLLSVLDNSVSPDEYEIILIDDGSPGNAREIIRSFMSRFRNIRSLEQENQGLSVSRMNGVASARGTYVWFIDSDDYLRPKALDTLLPLLKKETDVDVFVFPLLWTFPNPEKDHPDYAFPEETPSVCGKQWLRSQRFNVWGAPRYVLRRNLFDCPYLYFPKGLWHEDEYFGRVLLYLAERVRVMDSPLYCYRQHDDSITGTLSIRKSYDIVEVYKHLAAFASEVVFPEDLDWFQSQTTGFLLESYTKSRQLYHSSAFRVFRVKTFHYIWKTYRKTSSSFHPNKKREDYLLLLAPCVHGWLMDRIRKWKKR